MNDPEKHSSESEQSMMESTQKLADTFVNKLIHASPLSAALEDKIAEDYRRFATMKYPPVFPYASVELFSTHPDYPHHEITTTISVVRKPDGLYQTKSVRQALDTHYERKGLDPYEDFMHETLFDAFGGVSGVMVEKEYWDRNPRDKNGWFTLEIRYGFGPDGWLSIENHPPNHSFKTRIVLSQLYSDDRTGDPDRIEMHFPLHRRAEFSFPDIIYLDFPSPTHTIAGIPYDARGLSELNKLGIYLPAEGRVDHDGDFVMDIGLMDNAFEGEGRRIYIPSRADIYGETRYKLQLVVGPNREVSTVSRLYEQDRDDTNTWRPRRAII